MLGDRQAHALDICFLEAIASQQRGGDLPGNGYDGGGVHVSGGQPGNQVGSAWPRGGNANPYLARGPRIAIGHVGGTLLVGYQHVVDGVLIFGQVIVGGQDGPTG